MRDYAGTLPVLLDLDLYRSGWNGTINPYPGMSVKTKAVQSLRSSLLKKYQDEIPPEADRAALELFLKINEQCKHFSLNTDAMSNAEAIAIGEAKNFIYDFFYYPNESGEEETLLTLGKITDNFGLGNGANVGSYGTDFYSKLSTSHLSATSPQLHMLYLQAISSDPTWSDVESIRRANRTTDVVRGSRLSFVPKKRDISRTICTEPLCNMLFQKGIGSLLEGRLLEACGISLKYQPDKNRYLAQLGSKDGSFGTIDLSSASDSMSLGLVHSMFPKGVVSFLEMCRSPITTLPGGTEVELHMVSSMGNAFTFPLQTILFTSVVYGAYRVLGIPFERPWRRALGNFAVFGDDIIVERKAYDLTCRLLSLCGFSVNVDKSFNEGLFRESCGRDYYCGRNVRGVYLQTLRTDGDRYSAINRLNRWSAEWGIALTECITFLRKGLRYLPVPYDEMDDAGIKVPLRSLKSRTTNRYTGGYLYRYLASVPTTYDMTDCESRPPMRLKGYFHNPSGVLLAALASTLRAGRLSTRVKRKSTSIRRRYSSSWDYIVADRDASHGFGERWKSFVELNLNLY